MDQSMDLSITGTMMAMMPTTLSTKGNTTCNLVPNLFELTFTRFMSSTLNQSNVSQAFNTLTLAYNRHKCRYILHILSTNAKHQTFKNLYIGSCDSHIRPNDVSLAKRDSHSHCNCQ